ncbi:MAG: lanthionine synthetase LanC family protein [Acidobacteriota bacterium]
MMKRLLLTLFLAGFHWGWAAAEVPDYLQAARQAGEWLKENAIRTDHGTVWAVQPDDPRLIVTNLYSGTSGVVLFWLEYYEATFEEEALKLASSGADYLLATLPDSPEQAQAGLYTGISGLGFVLHQAYQVTGDEKYLTGARKVVQLLRDSAQEVGSGLQWNDVTDIIGGSAGTGLFLLYAAREFEPSARSLAVAAGKRLLERAKPGKGGLKWSMNDEFPRLMPNFSHGTAGIAYFLATLHQETKDEEFLKAALAGARYLQAISDQIGDGCVIFHHQPGGEELYYLSWCHGPAGTARLFYRLYEVTGDSEWMEWVNQLAAGIRQSGIPDQETPGYWNNVSQCCGAAGVAEFFLNLHRMTGDQEHLQFAQRMAQNLLGRATTENGRSRWVQAEHRVSPELLAAQTGYMQGAAGIGMMLLHLDALTNKRGRPIVFPDSPFQIPE